MLKDKERERGRCRASVSALCGVMLQTWFPLGPLPCDHTFAVCAIIGSQPGSPTATIHIPDYSKRYIETHTCRGSTLSCRKLHPHRKSGLDATACALSRWQHKCVQQSPLMNACVNEIASDVPPSKTLVHRCLTPRMVEHIRHLPKLRELDLSRTGPVPTPVIGEFGFGSGTEERLDPVSPVAMQALASMTHLTSLDLSW